jgi:hypothetical protein
LSTWTIQGVIVPRIAMPMSPAMDNASSASAAKQASRQFRAWTRPDPIRSSQSCPAR